MVKKISSEDLEYYCKLYYWNVHQAIALVLGLCPKESDRSLPYGTKYIEYITLLKQDIA